MPSSLAEVPLVYPCHVLSEGRFVVHDDQGTVSRATTTTIRGDSGTTDDVMPFYNASEQLVGSASISYLANDIVVTTCALPTEMSILSVAMTHQQQILTRMELDLGKTTLFGTNGTPTAKVQCFEDRLVLVDAKGVILTVNLQETTTLPVSCSVVSLPDLLEDDYAGAELYGSMVQFLSPTTAIVALSPVLLTVDLRAQELSLWSEKQTLQEMKSRTVGGIFAKASDLLLGTNDEDYGSTGVRGLEDSPVSSICLTELQGYSFVFTLHSDATLRRWRLNSGASTPSEVVLLTLSDLHALPSPSRWGETYPSVALSARTFDNETYALAIFIATASSDEDSVLTVLHGSPDPSEAIQSTMSLVVPEELTSFVGMEFKAEERCSLVALMKDADNAASIVTYPPSSVVIVSTEPTLTPCTLDLVSELERERLWHVACPKPNVTSDLDEGMHRMDKWFLQYLFRPMFPRGDGTVTAPTLGTIRMALARVVPGGRRRRPRDYELGSVELETLRALQDWRRLEQQSSRSPVRPSKTTTTEFSSIYDQYAGLEEAEDQMMMDVEDELEDEEEIREDHERMLQLDAHEQRWKKLLLAVHEEERRLCLPLCWSSSTLIRSGITSFLKECEVEEISSVFGTLDDTATTLLEQAENSTEWASNLHGIEVTLCDIVARAALVLPSTTEAEECLDELASLGTWALNQESAKCVTALELLSQLSEEDVIDWFQHDGLSSVARGLPGVAALSLDTNDISDRNRGSNTFVDSQTRHAACALYVQSVDSIRRLCLGRCLLLLGLGEVQSAHGAFRHYLHSLSVLWTSAQQVRLPTTGLKSAARQNVQFTDRSISPVVKRLSFSDEGVSILQFGSPGSSSVSMTTALDAHMLLIAKAVDGPAVNGDMCILLATSVFRSSLLFGGSRHPSSRPRVPILPELGALPGPMDETIASDYPRLALRLLAPFFAFPPLMETPNVTHARNEAVSECLLIEASATSQSGALSASMADMLRSRACELLVASEEIPSNTDHELLGNVFTMLWRQSEAMPSQQNLALDESGANEERLANFLQELLHGKTSQLETDVARLSRQATAKKLFQPFVDDSFSRDFSVLGERTETGTKTLAEGLLRLSNLMNRLSILERHIGTITGFGLYDTSSTEADLLLNYIESALTEIRNLLPDRMLLMMTEYATLWSLLFRHAVASQNWMKAYQACANHPVHEEKLSNYKRFVTAMVDAGALGELIDLCSILSTDVPASEGADSVGDSIDFYEVVDQTLENGRSLLAPQSIGHETDYLGCLYAVHASRGNWKSASQSMDMRHRSISKALIGYADEQLHDPMDEIAAVEDLVMTSLSSSIAIQLIRDPVDRYLVSDEVGFEPVVPLLYSAESDESWDRNKRGRDEEMHPTLTPFKVFREPSKRAVEGSRLSRLMATVDFSCRATRAIALRTAVLDGSDLSLSFVSLFPNGLASTDTDVTVFDTLAELGYYQEAILLAKARNACYEALTGKSRPEGRSLVDDLITRLLSSYIAPRTVRARYTPSDEYMEIEENFDRPSFSQLRNAADDVLGVMSCPVEESWNSASSLCNRAMRDAAMALVRNLTTSRANAANSFAAEIAEAFLDLNVAGELPTWLEGMLVGPQKGSANGLFARNAEGVGSDYMGDPSALMMILMKHGRYEEACDFVSEILLGSRRHGPETCSRETAAPSRLPENGDVDFVPYLKIDALWNLIERALADPSLNSTQKASLKSSRQKMESAIENHFELMKISEMGMPSARALSH